MSATIFAAGHLKVAAGSSTATPCVQHSRVRHPDLRSLDEFRWNARRLHFACYWWQI